MKVNLVLKANKDLEPINRMWYPSIATDGHGEGRDSKDFQSSSATFNIWKDEIGFSSGYYHVNIFQQAFNKWETSFAKQVLQVVKVVTGGGTCVVRWLGCHPSLASGSRSNWYAFRPTDIKAWGHTIYGHMITLTSASKYNLDPSKLMFSLWYGLFGADDYQYKDTSAAFESLWYTFTSAANKAASAVPVGGFGHDQDNYAWARYPLWGVNGFINQFNIKSESSGINIDWIDFQYRNPHPFAVSQLNVDSDQLRDLRLSLAAAGHTKTTAFPSVWQSQNRVTNWESARGEIIDRYERSSEIDAALIPTRIYDMELENVKFSWRESMQDWWSVGEVPFNGEYPFFRAIGGNGVFTVGTSANDESYLGLKKPSYFVFELMKKLEQTKFFSSSDSIRILSNNTGTINCMGTRNGDASSIKILVWSYISPFKYVTNSNITIQALHTKMKAEIGEKIDIRLALLGCPCGTYREKVYLIDREHSNTLADESTHWTNWQDGMTVAEINDTLSTDVIVDTTTRGGAIYRNYKIWPYTVMLISLDAISIKAR